MATATLVLVKGEIAEVSERGAAIDAERIIRFTVSRTFPNRPMLKEHLKLFGVEFQIKKILHEPDLVIRLTPATVTHEAFEGFVSDAKIAEWHIETVH